MAEAVVHKALSSVRRALRKFEVERTEERSTFQITVELERDELDGGWIAEVVELPGCMSQGETEAEALDNVLEAFREVLAAKLVQKFADQGVPHRHAGPSERHRETVRVPVAAAL